MKFHSLVCLFDIFQAYGTDLNTDRLPSLVLCIGLITNLPQTFTQTESKPKRESEFGFGFGFGSDSGLHTSIPDRHDLSAFKRRRDAHLKSVKDLLFNLRTNATASLFLQRKFK